MPSRGNWFWFVILGASLVVLGIVALGSVVVASLAAATAIGRAAPARGCGRGRRSILVPRLERLLPGAALGCAVDRRRAVVPGGFRRRPGGPDAAAGLLPDGRRVLQDRHRRGLSVRRVGLVAGRRDHRRDPRPDDLAAVAGVGAVGDRPVRGDQPAVPRIQLDRPGAGAAARYPARRRPESLP